MRIMITVLMLVAIAVVGGASLWWLFVASFGERQIGDASTEAEQAGWQVSYAELYISDAAWPEFGAERFDEAVRDYAGRVRRFGRTDAQLGSPQA